MRSFLELQEHPTFLVFLLLKYHISLSTDWMGWGFPDQAPNILLLTTLEKISLSLSSPPSLCFYICLCLSPHLGSAYIPQTVLGLIIFLSLLSEWWD